MTTKVYVKLASHLTTKQILDEIKKPGESELATVRAVLDNRKKNKIKKLELVPISKDRSGEFRKDALCLTLRGRTPKLPRAIPGFIKEGTSPEALVDVKKKTVDVFVKLAPHLTAGNILAEIARTEWSEVATVRAIIDNQRENKIANVGVVPIGTGRRSEGVRSDVLCLTLESDKPLLPASIPGLVKQAASLSLL